LTVSLSFGEGKEMKAKRIGEIMVEMSYICLDHLEMALEIQDQRDKKGKKV
jgi:hypothetical protein